MSMSPVYAIKLHQLTVKANQLGYGLLHHGSAIRDLDVVAIPFDSKPVSLNDMFRAAKDILGDDVLGPHNKAHKRVAWSFKIDEFHHVDFSIMDTIEGLDEI